VEFVENIGEIIALNPFLAVAAVFVGGILSSANPCVLVTIPMIIGYVGGYAGNNKQKALIYTSAFIIGLSVTFTALGLIAALAGMLFGDVGWFWQYLIGIVAIAMGLQLLGVYEFPQPNQAHLTVKYKGIVGSLLLGMLFGVISSPCATPVLAVILAFVAAGGNIVYGGSLLFVYALGHCVLMLLAGTFVGVAQYLGRSKGLAGFSYWTKKISGFIILVVGVYVLFM
jgi:cytochrome c-type biogenesis protein